MTTIMKNFVGLSAVLTGFSVDKLAPSLDPVDIKTEYLLAFEKNVALESKNSQLVTHILAKYAELKAQNLSDQATGESMLAASNSEAFVLACRKLIFLWYSGAWPTLSEDTGTTFSNLLSAKSYTAGLAWQVMQSHPMGDSNYRYGYWADVPMPLSAYTGNQGDTFKNSGDA